MEINYTMNLAQANSLFDAEAVFMYSADVVPEYRVIELFGDEMAAWLDSCCLYEGYMKAGRDYGAAGDVGEMIRYFYKSGFHKIVSKFNHRLLLHAHRASDAGKLADAVFEERVRELNRKESEEERKRAERRAKRAATKATKEQKAAGVGPQESSISAT